MTVTAVGGRVERPTDPRAWRAWVDTLMTGDEVLVCCWFRQEAIYRTTVRRTPSGQLRLDTTDSPRPIQGPDGYPTAPMHDVRRKKLP